MRSDSAPEPPHAEIVDSVEALGPYRAGWDRLAVEAQRPYCAPAWQLAWWQHAAPTGADLRIVLVHSGGELIGIAPLYALRKRGVVRYRILAAEISGPTEPLARPGHAVAVASAISSRLAQCPAPPHVIELQRAPAGSPWPELLASHWPSRRRPTIVVHDAVAAPSVALSGGDFDAWLGAKSGNFRQQMRRGRRRLEERGATFRVTGDTLELDRDLAELARLHRARWDPRGGSDALRPGVERMLHAAGHELVPEDRFQLQIIELDGRAVSAHLLLAAGGEVCYWLGGFDDAWASERPAMVSLVAAIEAAFEARRSRLDLGAGAQEYKYRLADGEDLLRSFAVVPASFGAAFVRLEVAKRRARTRAAAFLPVRIKKLLRC